MGLWPPDMVGVDGRENGGADRAGLLGRAFGYRDGDVVMERFVLGESFGGVSVRVT